MVGKTSIVDNLRGQDILETCLCVKEPSEMVSHLLHYVFITEIRTLFSLSFNNVVLLEIIGQAGYMLEMWAM